MEERMGNQSQALSLYKQVMERAEGHRDWYPVRSGHGSGGAISLYTQALRKIERLRSAVQH